MYANVVFKNANIDGKHLTAFSIFFLSHTIHSENNNNSDEVFGDGLRDYSACINFHKQQ